MATSGSIDTSSNPFNATDGSRYFILSWSATQHGHSAAHPHGYSEVSWALKGGGTSSQGIYCKNWQCQVGPQHKGNLTGTKIKLYNGTILESDSFVIDHDANGNASFSLGISGYIYYYGSNYERTASGTGELNRLTTYWDINVYDPNDIQGVTKGYTVGTFDEYISNVKQNTTPLNNELTDYKYTNQPYGTWVSIDNLKFEPQYQFNSVWNGQGTNLRARQIFTHEDIYGSGRYGHYITGYNDNLHIFTDWKRSELKLNANEGIFPSGEVEITITNTNKLIYNSNNWEHILSNEENTKSYIPIRVGYEFLGWYDSPNGGNKIYDANGWRILNQDGWWSADGKCQVTEDKILYAHWKTQNVTYIKDENNEWKLSTVYVKDVDNEWKPAIMYVKTENGWQQSVTK